MAKQSREIYLTGNPIFDRIFAKISERLDIVEGLRPDLTTGVFVLEDRKVIQTDTEGSFFKWDGSDDQLNKSTALASLGLGTMAAQDADEVNITGGLFSIQDHNGTTIHQFPISFLGATCEWFMFL